MSHDETPTTVDGLLRSAAAADARAARAVLARIDGVRLLELVATQAELAVDEERARAAGIDAVGDLERAAIELMGLPQSGTVEEEQAGPPTVTGWELVTLEPEELLAATLTVPVPSWALAVVAFRDEDAGDGGLVRRGVAAAADGRVVAVELHLTEPLGDATLRSARLAHEPAELGADADLAAALRAALGRPAP